MKINPLEEIALRLKMLKAIKSDREKEDTPELLLKEQWLKREILEFSQMLLYEE